MFYEKIKRHKVRIIIICLSILFLSAFVVQKKGFYVDEVLSFQLANSEFTPWIMPNQPQGRLAKFVDEHIEGDTPFETVKNLAFIAKDTLTNRGNSIVSTYKADVYDAPVWMPREHFEDYTECDGKDAFNLLSVYYNSKDDIHPPLYYMTVHLVSSVFQGEITVWHGCIINLICIAGALWLLGSIGNLIFKRKSSTVALMLLYGFSTGVIATALWVRMYAVLTLWLVWLLYLHIRKYKGCEEDSFLRISRKTGKAKWIGSYGLFFLAIATFLTQYFGLFFLVPLAVCTLVLLLKEKRIREFWSYVRTMATAAVVGIGVFPFALGDVFESAFGQVVASQAGSGLGRYFSSLASWFGMLANNVTGSVLLLVLSFLVPGAVWLYIRFKKGKSPEGECRIMFLCAIPAVFSFLLTVKMSPFFVERYLMPVFPFAILLIVLAWEKGFLPLLSQKKYDILCAGLALLILLIQIPGRSWEQDYFHRDYEEQLAVAEQYSEYPMVLLYTGFTMYDNVWEMQKYKESIMVYEYELEMMQDSHREKTKDGYVTVIKYPDDSDGERKLQEVMKAFGGRNAQLLGKWDVHGDVVYLVTP